MRLDDAADEPGGSVQPALVGEQGEGGAAAVEGPGDDVHGFRDEEPGGQAVWLAGGIAGSGEAHELLGVAQLAVGHGGEGGEVGVIRADGRCTWNAPVV